MSRQIVLEHYGLYPPQVLFADLPKGGDSKKLAEKRERIVNDFRKKKADALLFGDRYCYSEDQWPMSVSAAVCFEVE